MIDRPATSRRPNRRHIAPPLRLTHSPQLALQHTQSAGLTNQSGNVTIRSLSRSQRCVRHAVQVRQHPTRDKALAAAGTLHPRDSLLNFFDRLLGPVYNVNPYY
jgi:hypothetical protein